MIDLECPQTVASIFTGFLHRWRASFRVRGWCHSWLKMTPCWLVVSLFGLLLAGASAQCGPQAGYYSDPRQCDLYYECHNGTFIERLCPDGLVFDDRHVNQARCDFPHNVDCGSRNLMQAPQPSGNCPRKWGMFPHEQDCGHYWNCIEGRAHLISCPEGLAYSEVWSVCDWPDRVPSCDSEVYLGVQCPDPGQSDLQHYTMSHPSDCRRHYICVLRPEDKRYLPRLMSCEEGRVFNSYTLSCDLPENVPGCENYYGPAPVNNQNFLNQRWSRFQ